MAVFGYAERGFRRAGPSSLARRGRMEWVSGLDIAKAGAY